MSEAPKRAYLFEHTRVGDEIVWGVDHLEYPGFTLFVRGDLYDAIVRERDALAAQVARLEAALTPFAFLEEETTQEAWELLYRERFGDWISYEDIDVARAALTTGKAADAGGAQEAGT